MGTVAVSVLLLSAVRLKELEAVNLVLVAVLRKPRLGADIQVQMLLEVALRASNRSVLRPSGMASAQPDVQRRKALLPVEDGSTVLGGRFS